MKIVDRSGLVRLAVLLSLAAMAPGGAARAATGHAAEDSRPADRPYWRRNLFGRFFRDQKFLFTTWWPSEFRDSRFTVPLFAGVALAATSARSGEEAADAELENDVRNASGGRVESAARDFSLAGDGAPAAVLLGAGYLLGRWSGHDQIARVSSLSAEALLTAGLYTTALKFVTARGRPESETSGSFFNYGRVGGAGERSFPSGHATEAFTLATVFAGVYREHRWVPWVAYGTAGLIGLSRVALGRHFTSDVIVGGVLGNSIGRMVVARDRRSKPSGSTLRPILDPGGGPAGIVWIRDW